MKRLQLTITVLLVSLLMFLALRASAEPLGEFCWRMSPFDDTFHVSASWETSTGLITLRGEWLGLDVYSLDGFGTAGNGINGLVTYAVTLHNPSGFFNANPICRLHGMIGANLVGIWALDCMTIGVGHPVFTQNGEMDAILCPTEEARVSSTIQANGHMRLAGERAR